MSRLTIRRTHQIVLAVTLAAAIAGSGDAIEASVADLSTAGRWIIGVGAWALWGVALTSVAVRLPATLVTLRLATVTGLVAVVVALIVADLSASEVAWAITPPLVVLATSLSPFVGEAWIDGASYGDELRFSLRVPMALALVGLPLGVMLFVGGVLTGPIMLANERWIIGSVTFVVGLYLAMIAARALNGLARRWLVLVPAGLVLHDHLATREAFLMIKSTVASVGPAPPEAELEDDSVLDATGDSPGAVIEIALTNVVECVPRTGRGQAAAVAKVGKVYVVPTRPLAFVTAARSRGLGRA